MNFKQLEAFLWVAELQSFTKASRQLFMSQPAVSFQIKALEENLKVVLFERGDKKVMLTEAGRLLYPEAKQMLRHYNKIKAGLDELKGLKKGSLTIGASTIPGEYVLPLLIGSFKEKYPGIKIALKVSGSGQVARWIKEREIDLGITGRPFIGEDIECTPWIEDQLILIVHPSHKWAGKMKITPPCLKDELMILREEGSGTRKTIEQKLSDHNVKFEKIGMELGSTRAVITAVEAGLGAGFVSSCAAREALELGKVKEVFVEGMDLKRHLYQVRHKQGFAGFAIDAFTSFINQSEILKGFLPC